MTAIDWRHKTHARSNCAILNYGADYNTSVMTYYDNIPGLEKNIEKIKRKLEAAKDGIVIKKLEGLLAHKLATLAHLQAKKISTNRALPDLPWYPRYNQGKTEKRFRDPVRGIEHINPRPNFTEADREMLRQVIKRDELTMPEPTHPMCVRMSMYSL